MPARPQLSSVRAPTIRRGRRAMVTTNGAGQREETDVVVVGARVAGSPAAIELARAGRGVIVLDAGTFPSDTLSTHVIFPTCVAELNALGALEPLLATGSPTMPDVTINHGGIDVH